MVLIALRGGRRAVLRPAEEGDLAPSAQLLRPLFQSGALHGVPPDPVDLAAAVWAGTLFVADAHSELAGVLLLRAGLVGVAVAPAYRRQGVGTALVGIGKSRHRMLRAHVDAANAPSRALFAALGFRDASTRQNILTLTWRALSPVKFVADGTGALHEDIDGRPGGRLVRLGGHNLLLDPTGGEGYLDALAPYAAPEEIFVTRPAGHTLRHALLGTFRPLAAVPECRTSLIEVGIVPERTARLPQRTEADAP